MLRGRGASLTRAAVGLRSQAAERAWGLAQPEKALHMAAMDGALAACTRLLGAGTHPVGYKVSESNWLPSAAPPPSLVGRRSNRTGGESGSAD